MQKNKYKIPDDLRKKISSTKWRKQLLQKCGSKAFGDPEKLSYPLMDDKCKYRICLVHAAYVRSREFKDVKVMNKVKPILDKLEKQQQIKPQTESEELLEMGVICGWQD